MAISGRTVKRVNGVLEELGVSLRPLPTAGTVALSCSIVMQPLISCSRCDRLQ
jgi:hypothetical protein